MDTLRLLRRRGLRKGWNTIEAALARKYLRAPLPAFENLQVVMTEPRPACLPHCQSETLRINWLLPSIGTAQGGLFNVFRAIQQLEAWGHENRVYILGNIRESQAVVKERIRTNYFPINAEVEILSNNIKDSDALIATSWPTAYAANGIGNTAKKFYFVQDIEYMFYASGSMYEFARQTYQFGFHGITAGSWIADVLRRDFNMQCSVFGFSYDRAVYTNDGPRLLPAGKKRVLFYARPETERRGFELGILALSIVSKINPEAELVMVGFTRPSVELPISAVFPGVLAISELGALYRSCDVALVLSHTNLSLLPLEIMACGCAVVSNEGANAEWLLTAQTVEFAKADPRSLADAIILLLESDALRLQKIEAGLAFAQSTDWIREIKSIESALFVENENPNDVGPHA
jgi:glycosyltransferase involved in cell wall biosynthesis